MEELRSAPLRQPRFGNLAVVGSPLDQFCRHPVVEALLDAHADIAHASRFGNTPLMLAAKRGNLVVVQHLVSEGAEIDAKNNNGNTALMLAAQAGHMGLVQALLRGDADPGLRNKKREQAIVLAETAGHDDIVSLLQQRKTRKKRLLGLF